MTSLFTVSATMSSACRIGTPERSSIPAVLENRDSAVLWNSVPKIGILSLIASRFARPFSVFLYRLNRNTMTKVTKMNTYQYFFTASEAIEQHPRRQRQRAAQLRVDAS